MLEHLGGGIRLLPPKRISEFNVPMLYQCQQHKNRKELVGNDFSIINHAMEEFDRLSANGDLVEITSVKPKFEPHKFEYLTRLLLRTTTAFTFESWIPIAN
jgi:hypothetical protein